MHITVLIENSPGSDERLRHEHGLSLYVEANGSKLLFDLGPSSHFASNAEVLGIDPSAADMAVISHGHFDHGGGLACFLEMNPSAPVYLRRGADGPHYSVAPRGERYIGLDQGVLAANADRLRWVDGETEIAPGIHMLTRVPNGEPRPAGNARLLVKENDRFVPDRFEHEMFCVILEDDGMTVITGCGHSGITNMIRAAKEYFPGRPVKAVVGGLHLSNSPAANDLAMDEKGIKAFARILTGLGCAKVVTGHCTGERAASLLQGRMGERLVRMRTGKRMDF